MSIRTLEQLYDTLSDELTWRKKELTSLKLLSESSGIATERQIALLRALVALLYAHWEGFIKNASGAYMEYVSFQRLRYNELSRNFVVLGARKLFRTALDTNSTRDYLILADFFMSKLSEKSAIPYRDVIIQRGNMSSKVFREIVNMIGLEYSEYETKEILIDDKLIESRNSIAHGKNLYFTQESYADLSTQIINIMEHFRNQIDNAATMKIYKRSQIV